MLAQVTELSVKRSKLQTELSIAQQRCDTQKKQMEQAKSEYNRAREHLLSSKKAICSSEELERIKNEVCEIRDMRNPGIHAEIMGRQTKLHELTVHMIHDILSYYSFTVYYCFVDSMSWMNGRTQSIKNRLASPPFAPRYYF